MPPQVDGDEAALSEALLSLDASTSAQFTGAFECGKAKAARLACLGASTTDEAREGCNATYCPTISNNCSAVPPACRDLEE